MTAADTVIAAELTWSDGSFRPDLAITVAADGLIAAVGPASGAPTERRPRQALLPGFVNAHSHAFQRGLRGRGETFPESGGTFWTWREAMYGLVEAMDEATMERLARRAFAEMLAAGITTVGEFHYLHHDRDDGGFAFDEVVLRAAAATGIRIVLLHAYYRTGDIDRPLAGGQRRFAVESPEAYWTQVDTLADRLHDRQTLGVVAHSIRAVGLDDLVALHEEAARRHLVFHMHVEEQPREIEACVHRYHQTPMALLNDRVEISPRFTAVHCTHTAASDMAEFLEAGGNVCICPLTEANLGDGLADVRTIRKQSGRICLGTDSNARLSMLEEMRWLEYGQRLRTQSRGVCVDETGRVATTLLTAATSHGAQALGLRAGGIAPGRHADFVAIDLDHPSLAETTPETLLEAIVLGASDDVIVGTCVGGQWVYER